MNRISYITLKVLAFVLVVGIFVTITDIRSAAAACVQTGSGTWSATASFTGCSGAASAGAGTGNRPGAGEALTANAGLTLTVDVNTPTIASYTISTSGVTATTLTINSGASLTISGTFTVPQTTGASTTQTFSILGTLDVGALTFTGTTSGRNTTISIDNAAGKFTLRGTMTVSSGGTKTIKSTAAGTVELISATVPNTSTLTWGTFASGTNLVNTSGSSSIAKTTAIATWGNCTITAGTLTTAALYTCTGSTFTNNGTWAGTGGVTLSNASASISGTGSITNSGTITISGTTAPTLASGSSQTFNNLTLAANALFTVNGTLTISNALTIAASTTASKTPLTVGSTGILTVTGITTFNLPTAAITATVSVGAGTATFGGLLTMTGSTVSAIGKISLTTGTLNFNAGIATGPNGSGTYNVAADHVIDISGDAGTLSLKGQVSTGTSANASGWTFTNTTCTNGGGTFIYADIGASQNVNMPGVGGYCNLTVLSNEGILGAAITTSTVKGNINIGNNTDVVSLNNIGFGIAGNTGKTFTVHDLAKLRITGGSEQLPTGFTVTYDANSTVEFDTTAGFTLISGKTYGNIAFKPTTAGLTFTLPATITINGDIIIGDGTNAVTVNADTNDPTLNIPDVFTINNGGTFVASSTSSLTVGGVMTIGGGTSGTFTESGGIIYLNNNLVINAGATFTDNATSQLRFTKGSAQTITDNTATKQDLGAVFTATTGTSVTSTTSIAVTDLTIGSGTSFDISTDTLTLSDTSGTLITNSGTFTTTGSTIAVTGSGTKTLASGVSTINNLTISSTGTNNTSITSNLTLNGDLVVGSTSTLTVNTATLTVSGSVSNAGTLVSSYSSGLLSVGANWTNTGTYTAGTSTVKLVSTSSSDITFAGGGSTYNNVWLAHGSGTGDYVITGDNTFNDFKDDGTAAHSILFTAGSTTTVTTFTVSGTSGNLITINSGDGAGGTSTATHTLTKAGGGTISVDYVSVQHSVATPSSTWTAGINSTDNNSVATAGSGWSFTTSSQGPYGGTPWNIPGTIQFEDFDTGGQGVAYNDTDPLVNQAGQYRPSEGVDIEVTQDISGAYNIGWVYNTEWTEYTVNVTTAGTYTLSLRVASLASGSLPVLLDGSALVTVSTPNTGGYQVWQTATSSNFSLSSGSHILRFNFDNNGTNYNYMTFNLIAASGCTSTATGNWNDSTKWNCGHVPTTNEDVTITSGHTITMNVDSAVVGNITVNGTLNTSGYALSGTSIAIGASGSLSAGSSTITLSGTSGSLLSSAGGTFTPGSSTLVLSGNGTAMINSGITTLNSVNITGTGTKYVGSATTLNGSLTIGATSTFGAGFDMTVSGSVTNNGTYVGDGWQYYKKVTIDHTKVPNTDQTDFPVLINGIYTDLKSVAYGGHVFSNSGYDIAFFSDQALTTPLKWEVETYTPTSGLLIAWVKVPSLSHTSDTSIYIGYGNIGVTTDQSDKNNVWDSNYKAVWHLDESVSGNGQTLANSTSFSENLTTNSSSTYSGVQSTAPVGNGMSLNKATNDYLSFPQVTLTGAWTVEGWVKLTASPDQFSSLFGNGTSGGGLIFNTNWFSSLYRAWDGSTDDIVATTTISSGTWYHYVITRSGTAMALYLNGNSDKTSTNGKNAVFQQLGVNADGSTTNTILFDEVRISTTQRSADWVKTEYNNQNSPSTFYTMGTESSATSSSASTISVAGSWTNAGTFSATGATIKMTDNSGNPTFAGGGATYTKLWFAPGAGTGSYTISGNNSFGELKDDGSAAHTVKFTAGSTQTITTWNISGTSGNLITIDSTTTGTHNLVKADGAAQTRADYLNIKHSVASPADSWYAGDNSVNNQDVATAGSGWIFTTQSKHRGGGGSVRSAGGETDNGTGTGTCADGVQNGNETGIDTGGRCGNTGGGNGGGGTVDNGTGTGTCSDQIQNGNETGVDTGGRCGNSGGGSGGGGGDVGFIFFFQQITLPAMSMWFAFR